MPLARTHDSRGIDNPVQTSWKSVLELDSTLKTIAGSEAALREAIGRGADLRIFTDFRHNEHIDTKSPNNELVLEVSEFAVTYLVNNAWSAGIMTLRQPIDLPVGFGPRASMSFFLYNQNGEQAIARPYLDGKPTAGEPGPSIAHPPPDMPKYRTIGNAWDDGTNAPSHNFIYHFGSFRYCVADVWREVLAHDAGGKVISGSLDALTSAFAGGCEMKVGIRGLCDDLTGEAITVEHEVFVRAGPGYYYTEQRLFMVGSHPVVRVRPQTPMRYTSREWDFGWLMLRTDGQVVYRRCDPYTLKFEDRKSRHAIRWFVR